jgi:uncharacterized membrane protein YphA (DoxX/SURF4 family)
VNVVLWILAGILAAAFAMSGLMKVTQSKEQLAPKGPWVEDFSEGTVKAIGALEVLAAVGLVLPAVLDVAPVLVPLAALGLVVLMAGAAITHLRRREAQVVPINAALLILAAVVAWGRFGPYAF